VIDWLNVIFLVMKRLKISLEYSVPRHSGNHEYQISEKIGKSWCVCLCVLEGTPSPWEQLERNHRVFFAWTSCSIHCVAPGDRKVELESLEYRLPVGWAFLED
jgi:hypothetical protein